MPRKILFLLLCTALWTNVSAQHSKTITLQDAETSMPIAGAFFAYDTLQFGVSGADGSFTLLLQAETLALQVSHLAYGDTILRIPPNGTSMVLSLRPESIALPEIKVSDQVYRKFRDPKSLLKMALKAVEDNYVTTDSYAIGRYRETILHDDCPASVAEGVFEYRLSPYGEKHSHRKAWDAGWDRRYASYPRPFSKGGNLFFDHAEGTQHYPAVNDAYRPIKTRYSNLRAPLERYNVFTDGPLDLVTLDKVRLGYDFLSPKKLRDYEYSLIDSAFVGGEYCYHLTFRPASDEPTAYHALSKVPRVAAFSGDIYVSIRELAIVRYEAWNSKVVVRNYSSPKVPFAPVNTLHASVEYRRTSNGKWQLQQARARTTSPKNERIQAVRALYLDNRPTNFSAAPKQRWYGFNFLNHLQNLTYNYDSTFWTDFERSSLYRVAQKYEPQPCAQNAEVFNFSHAEAEKTVRLPRVSPRGTLSYVREGKERKKDWEWLEEKEDSATLAYLRWENDYYAQYFLKQRPTLDAVAAQFSGEAQGITPGSSAPVYPDTTFKREEQGLGFYRITSANDKQLLAGVTTPPQGYVISDAGWSQSGRFYYLLAQDRSYDGVLTIYTSAGKEGEIHWVDDYHWVQDTLFATTNNAVLRTHALHRWTSNEGWAEVKREPNDAFEFRLQTLPDGELVVLSESLAKARLYRQVRGAWQEAAVDIPALLAGTGPEGLGCSADIEGVDYIVDCRELGQHSYAIAAKDARHQLFVRQSSEARWTEVDLPAGFSIAAFSDTDPQQVKLRLEGVGQYGFEATIDPILKQIQLLPTTGTAVNLEGYKDSIILVNSKDGTLIPCQMRWRINQTDSLKNTLLKVYGAYGNPYFTGHSEADIAMMNLGFVVVYVHVRGGGVRGPAWYDAGRRANKTKACTDYLAALTYFKERHPLKPTPLSGQAQSAGGPILGYAVNERPDLLAAAVFDHAFLDVAGLMQRPELPLTKYEYEEWGDPAIKAVRQAQQAYSPFQNIIVQRYPAMLFIAGKYDQSTPYWQIAKFIASLRWKNKDTNNIVFRTNLRGSHPGTPFGPSQAQLYEQIAFLLSVVQQKDQ